jgi:hypothetical protein
MIIQAPNSFRDTLVKEYRPKRNIKRYLSIILTIGTPTRANTNKGNLNSKKYIYLNDLLPSHETCENGFVVAETS